MKILAFDVETTGTDPLRDDIIQLAALMIVDDTVVDTFEHCCRPSEENVLRMYATKDSSKPHPLIDKITAKELEEYPHPVVMYRNFLNWLSRHIDKFDTTDKAWPLAYNGSFDMGFLSEFFRRMKDPYLGSWINWNLLDPLALLRVMEFLNLVSPMSHHNLQYVHNILIGPFTDPHRALSDIRATYAIFKHLRDVLGAL